MTKLNYGGSYQLESPSKSLKYRNGSSFTVPTDSKANGSSTVLGPITSVKAPTVHSSAEDLAVKGTEHIIIHRSAQSQVS
jgi:hypothetical protein